MKVVRVQNIPAGHTAVELHQLLSSAFGPDVDIQADLAPSCCMHDGTQIAVVKFSPRLPDDLAELAADPIGEKSIFAQLGSLWVSFDKHFFGLTQLYPTDPTRAVTADIVAVTGLNGRPFDSWRGQDPQGRMWLRNFFAVDLPTVRTMIFGYNTKWRSKGVGTIEDFVTALSLELRKARRLVDNPNRPLIFIGHSFGAIIVARLLSYWKDKDKDPFMKSALQATRAVFLFGAPHRGMDITDLVDMAKGLSAEHRMELLNSLGYESFNRLTAEMERFIELAESIKFFSAYEGKLTQRLARSDDGEREYTRSGSDFLFVSKHSALLGLPSNLEQRIPVDSDHSNMVKFDHPSDPTYQTTLQYIQEILQITETIDQGHVVEEQAEFGRSESELQRPRTPTSNSRPKDELLEFDKDGLTPYHRAALASDGPKLMQIYQQLGRYKAATLKDSRGKTALHHAAHSSQQASLLQFLIYSDPSATLCAKDRHGQTPLHVAAKSGNRTAVSEFVNASPNRHDYIRMKDDDGYDAIQTALRYGHGPIAHELQMMTGKYHET